MVKRFLQPDKDNTQRGGNDQSEVGMFVTPEVVCWGEEAKQAEVKPPSCLNMPLSTNSDQARNILDQKSLSYDLRRRGHDDSRGSRTDYPSNGKNPRHLDSHDAVYSQVSLRNGLSSSEYRYTLIDALVMITMIIGFIN